MTTDRKEQSSNDKEDGTICIGKRVPAGVKEAHKEYSRCAHGMQDLSLEDGRPIATDELESKESFNGDYNHKERIESVKPTTAVETPTDESPVDRFDWNEEVSHDGHSDSTKAEYDHDSVRTTNADL